MNRKEPGHAKQDAKAEKDHGGSGAQPRLSEEDWDTRFGGQGVQQGGRGEGQEPSARKKPELSERAASNILVGGTLVGVLVIALLFYWL